MKNFKGEWMYTSDNQEVLFGTFGKDFRSITWESKTDSREWIAIDDTETSKLMSLRKKQIGEEPRITAIKRSENKKWF